MEVNGTDHLNMIFNELIENLELKNKKRVIIEVFETLKYILSILLTRIV